MCGRYTLTAPGEGIADLFELPAIPEMAARYNIAPTQNTAVVRALASAGPRQLDMLRWGLIPYWANDLKIGSRMINARAETAATKPSFRNSLKKKRCLVVADGYYEWKKEGAIKQPYRIIRQGGQPFAFAGLWDLWKGPDGPVESFTILTCDAAPEIRPLHHRMPVIVEQDEYNLWLDPEMKDPAELETILQPRGGDLLEDYPVDRRVGNPRNEGPECVKRIT
ncbi:MAG: SOS response-associated peptidase [Acidobacteriota bacterium]